MYENLAGRNWHYYKKKKVIKKQNKMLFKKQK